MAVRFFCECKGREKSPKLPNKHANSYGNKALSPPIRARTLLYATRKRVRYFFRPIHLTPHLSEGRSIHREACIRRSLRMRLCWESCTLFRVLRYRTPSSPIHLSEETHKPFASSQVLLLSSGGKSVLLVKAKAPSRSGLPLSTHVVLKTRHANPNIHVCRY